MNKKARYYFLGILLTLSTCSAVEPDQQKIDLTKSFSDGFNLAFKSLNGKEYNIQGLNEEEVKFEEFIVYVDATDLDDAKRFTVQTIGFMYDDAVRIKDTNWIVIGSFSREANAAAMADSINRRYFKDQPKNRQCFVYQVPKGKVFYKEKSFFHKIAEIMRDKIKEEMSVLYIESNAPAPSPVPMKVDMPKAVQYDLETAQELMKKKEKEVRRVEEEVGEPMIKKVVMNNIKKDTIVDLSGKKSTKAVNRVSDINNDDVNISKPKIIEVEDKKDNGETTLIKEVIFEKQFTNTYRLLGNFNDKMPTDSNFKSLGTYENTGAPHISSKQRKTQKGSVYYYVEDLDFWVKKEMLIEVQ